MKTKFDQTYNTLINEQSDASKPKIVLVGLRKVDGQTFRSAVRYYDSPQELAEALMKPDSKLPEQLRSGDYIVEWDLPEPKRPEFIPDTPRRKNPTGPGYLED